MAAKSTPAPTPAAAKPAAKPAGKARQPRASASATADKTVTARKLTAAEQKAGKAKLAKPTPGKAAPKPAAKGKSKPASGANPVRREVIDQVRKLRATGMKWGAVAEETGITLSALARVRATAKRE